ncbi:MAG: ECF transporter S component, partial [Erysipelothrix sp.]|nr:ECF transporter S component [Erysipelothrix sp.]
EIANFFAGVALMLPIIYAYRTNPKKLGWVGIAIGTVLATIVMSIVNLYITFPLYGIPEEIRWNLIVTTFTPFNILKGFLVGLVYALIYPKLRTVIERFMSK